MLNYGFEWAWLWYIVGASIKMSRTFNSGRNLEKEKSSSEREKIIEEEEKNLCDHAKILKSQEKLKFRW